MRKFFLWGFVFFSPAVVFAEVLTIPEKIDLRFDDRTVVLDFKKNPEFIQNEISYYLVVNGKELPIDLKGLLPEDVPYLKVKTVFEPEVSPFRLFNFLNKQFYNADLEDPTVRISVTEKYEIVFEGRPKSGFKVDKIKTLQLINEAIKNGATHIRVPSKKIYSKVEIDKTLKERGIKEVVSIGESNFTGSPATRKQNIRAAAKKYHGHVVPQGETFSFNKILDRVEEAGGFARELVIKGDGLSKEYGGGVCQVSTTAFRAAFQGGFPITQRRNHSYDVPYYTPVGLDATIYLGGQDFRFTNDTPGDILIQTYTEGDNLFFVFYGSHDDRRVVLEGPFISEVEDAPKDSVVIYTYDLPAGASEVISTAHEGMKAKWVRTIIREEEQKSETLASYYRPWPKQILKGTSRNEPVTSSEEVEELLAETVPIEEPLSPVKEIEEIKERKLRTVGGRMYGRNANTLSDYRRSSLRLEE